MIDDRYCSGTCSAVWQWEYTLQDVRVLQVNQVSINYFFHRRNFPCPFGIGPTAAIACCLSIRCSTIMMRGRSPCGRGVRLSEALTRPPDRDIGSSQSELSPALFRGSPVEAGGSVWQPTLALPAVNIVVAGTACGGLFNVIAGGRQLAPRGTTNQNLFE